MGDRIVVKLREPGATIVAARSGAGRPARARSSSPVTIRAAPRGVYEAALAVASLPFGYTALAVGETALALGDSSLPVVAASSSVCVASVAVGRADLPIRAPERPVRAIGPRVPAVAARASIALPAAVSPRCVGGPAAGRAVPPLMLRLAVASLGLRRFRALGRCFAGLGLLGRAVCSVGLAPIAPTAGAALLGIVASGLAGVRSGGIRGGGREVVEQDALLGVLVGLPPGAASMRAGRSGRSARLLAAFRAASLGARLVVPGVLRSGFIGPVPGPGTFSHGSATIAPDSAVSQYAPESRRQVGFAGLGRASRERSSSSR